ELGSRLGADLEHVAEAATDDEQRARAFALEERVRRERRAHADLAGRDRLVRAEPEQLPNADQRGIVRRQHFQHTELAGLPIVQDAVRERSTPVDPDVVAHRERLYSACGPTPGTQGLHTAWTPGTRGRHGVAEAPTGSGAARASTVLSPVVARACLGPS